MDGQTDRETGGWIYTIQSHKEMERQRDRPMEDGSIDRHIDWWTQRQTARWTECHT